MIGHAPHDDTDGSLATRVRALLERQHELLMRLDEMSRRQMTLIEQDRAERLLELIGERQHVIDQLQKASELLDPLRPAWSETISTLPEREQEAVRSRLDSISMLMDQINARDEDARRQLARRRDQIAVELMSIGRGRGALAAYGGGGARRRPSFQDREA
jgi:hypothetical protein